VSEPAAEAPALSGAQRKRAKKHAAAARTAAAGAPLLVLRAVLLPTRRPLTRFPLSTTGSSGSVDLFRGGDANARAAAAAAGSAAAAAPPPPATEQEARSAPALRCAARATHAHTLITT
jgi:hypothetical protein